MILTPKNWTSFQHYKDRNPPWIKLHKSLLDNWEYQCLPDASKALAPMLWLLASEHPDGVIEMSEDALMFRLRKTLPELITAIQPLVSSGFFTCDSDLLAPCKQNAVPEKRREEAYKPEEKEERPPSAPSVPLLKVKKEKPPKKIKTTALKPECVAVFQTTWDSPPKTVRKVDKELNDWVNDPVAKGSRMQAERNFQGIVDSGVATADELCYAFQAYCLEGIGPKKGFFQHVSTFFGPEKSTYLEWLERARQIALEFV